MNERINKFEASLDKINSLINTLTQAPSLNISQY